MMDRKNVVIAILIVLLIVAVSLALTCNFPELFNKSKEEKEGMSSGPLITSPSVRLYQAGINDERDDDIGEGEPWQEAIRQMGLEQSVLDSHNAFVKDRSRSTTGASNQSVREYDNDVVPWVGLRRPRYEKLTIGSSARTVPSEYADQLPNAKAFVLN